MQHLLLADRKIYKKVDFNLQKPSMLWKLLVSLAVTVRDARVPFFISTGPPVGGFPCNLNQAVPLLKVQLILPIPSGPDICCR